MAIVHSDVRALISDRTLPADMDIAWAVRDATSVVSETLVLTDVPDVRKEMIAKWLAAHFVVMNVERGGLQSDRMGDASQTYFDRGYVTGLRSTRYGEMAITLDPTGELAKLANTAVRGKAEFRVV